MGGVITQFDGAASGQIWGTVTRTCPVEQTLVLPSLFDSQL